MKDKMQLVVYKAFIQYEDTRNSTKKGMSQ